MNERVRQLAEQAMESAGLDGLGGEYRELNPERFAELIVKRCIQVCDGNHEYKNRTDTDFGKGVSVGIQMSKEQIKAHFGVDFSDDEVERCPKCNAEWSGTSCGLDDCGWIVEL